MRIIDLSVALETGIASDPPMMAPKIQYQGHADTPDQITGFFPGMTNAELPEGEATTFALGEEGGEPEPVDAPLDEEESWLEDEEPEEPDDSPEPY